LSIARGTGGVASNACRAEFFNEIVKTNFLRISWKRVVASCDIRLLLACTVTSLTEDCAMASKKKPTPQTDLLADYLDLEPFAVEVGRTTRTVRRWMDEPNGLPFTRIGNRRLIHVPTAKAWILGRVRTLNPKRERKSRATA
jgi:hypothetical protein